MVTFRRKPAFTFGCRLFFISAFLFVLFSSQAPHCSAAQLTRTINYLYVEANEGDSSGGHTALRFEKQTFHFQHEQPGIVRIRRIDATAFTHLYAKLGNRTIHESEIAVSDETYTILFDAMTRLFLIQEAQLATRDELKRNAALIELLIRYHNNDRATRLLPVKGLGYFQQSADQSSIIEHKTQSTTANPLSALRDKILSKYGAGFIDEKIELISKSILELELCNSKPPIFDLSRSNYPSQHTNTATIYNNSLTALAALELLKGVTPLAEDAVITLHNDNFKLGAPELAILNRYAAQLENDLISLLNSSRQDWGVPFIVGMARLAALSRSISEKQLFFLDIYSTKNTPNETDIQITYRYLPAIRDERSSAFMHWRKDFFSNNEIHESEYAALERAGNLLINIEQSVEMHTLPRQVPDSSFPDRDGSFIKPPLPVIDDITNLAEELKTREAIVKEYDTALTKLYAYNIISRNCVTEIFTIINSALEQQENKGSNKLNIAEESVRRLGGYVNTAEGLNFIPFVSANRVNKSYAVIAERKYQSYRQEKLQEMEKKESPLIVFLRESNTITSTIYQPTSDDSPFLFFTDDVFILRPPFGAFNLLVGAGSTLLGLAEMPFSGSQRLLSGLRGIMFSLPELFFINLRKGSIPYVEQNIEQQQSKQAEP